MKILNSMAVSALALSAAVSAANAAPLLVTNGNDAGDGSLRAALAAAAQMADGAQVLITTNDDIIIQSGLVYTGIAPLTLIGNGQTVMSRADADILAITNGADLTVAALNFTGAGGFDIQNPHAGDVAGKGIFVDIRDDQTGTMTLNLSDVTVAGVAGHGVHVSDCALADACGGGGGGFGEGSAASISITLENVVISDVGNGRFDADGLRVDERGAGDIVFASSGSLFTGVGADGVELDEGQAGSVHVVSRNDVFRDNGGYCDPDVLMAFMPASTEGAYVDGTTTLADIPGPVSGSADDGCFEREVSLYDSGNVEEFEIGLDFDDGFDVDEAGPGSITALVVGGLIVGNLDEGLDFDEEDGGDIVITLWDTKAGGNTDDGFKHSESGTGDVIATMVGVQAANNGGKGAVFEEENSGDVTVKAVGVMTSNNDDSIATGIEVNQEGTGTGVLELDRSDIADGVDSEGVEVVAG